MQKRTLVKKLLMGGGFFIFNIALYGQEQEVTTPVAEPDTGKVVVKDVYVEGKTSPSSSQKQQLEEVTVTTAMGVKSTERSLGYSVAIVSGATVANADVANPATALQGKVAGLQIEQTSGNGVSATPKVSLRGAKSFSGLDQPIWVIDGIVLENTTEITQGPFSDGVDYGNQLKNLNPDDFENITVLKGAAATALYGSRGLNGAIVITSKKGTKKGIGVDVGISQSWETVYRPSVDLQNQYGMGHPSTGLSSYEGYDALFNHRVGTDYTQVGYTAGSYGPKYTDLDGRPIYITGIAGFNDLVPYTAAPNNYKYFYRNGSYTNANVALYGASDAYNYRLSYTRNWDRSIFQNNNFDKNGISFNGGAKWGKIFSSQINIQYANSKVTNPQRQNNSDGLLTMPFVYGQSRMANPGFWHNQYVSPDGTLNSTVPMAGNFFFLDYDRQQRVENSLIGSINVQALLVNKEKTKVDLSGQASFSYYQTNTRLWKPDGTNVLTGVDAAFYGEWLSQTTQYNYNIQAHYAQELPQDFKLDARLGTEIYGNFPSYNANVETNGGFITPGIYHISNSKLAPIYGKGVDYSISPASYQVLGIFGIVQASWKEQVYLELTSRNDFSSTQLYPDATGIYSYFYPGISSSWIFTETFRYVIPTWISFGKIRASWAQTGRGLRDAYMTNIGYNNIFINTPISTPILSNSIYNGSVLLPEESLKPEINSSYEFGADVRFFDNRLRLDATWYRSNTKNQVLNIAVPPESGIGSLMVNAGNFQNTGMEFLVSATPIVTKDWTWEIAVNFGFNRSRVIEFYPGYDIQELASDYNQGDLSVVSRVGGAFGVITSGWQSKLYDGENQANVGKRLIEDDNLYSFKFSREFVDKEDPKRRDLANIQPDLTGGLTTSLSWKGITLSTSFQFRFGGYIYSATSQLGVGVGSLQSTTANRSDGLPRKTTIDGNTHTFNDGIAPKNAVFADGYILAADHKYNITGKNENLGGMTYKEAYDAGLISAWQSTAFYAQQGSWARSVVDKYSDDEYYGGLMKVNYIAVRDISIGYRIPQKWLRKVFIQGLYVRVFLQNPFFLYNSLKDRINPDGLARTNNAFDISEFGGVAYSRRWGFALNFNF
ncbi:MAG: SusC/RagA family TonB-linked outer membrane protein [Chitinophagaceae bacterium]